MVFGQNGGTALKGFATDCVTTGKYPSKGSLPRPKRSKWSPFAARKASFWHFLRFSHHCPKIPRGGTILPYFGRFLPAWGRALGPGRRPPRASF